MHAATQDQGLCPSSKCMTLLPSRRAAAQGQRRVPVCASRPARRDHRRRRGPGKQVWRRARRPGGPPVPRTPPFAGLESLVACGCMWIKGHTTKCVLCCFAACCIVPLLHCYASRVVHSSMTATHSNRSAAVEARHARPLCAPGACAQYTNTGACVDLFAPGTVIISACGGASACLCLFAFMSPACVHALHACPAQQRLCLLLSTSCIRT